MRYSEHLQNYSNGKKEPSSFFVTLILASIVSFIPLVVYWRLVSFQGVIGDLLNKQAGPDFFVFYKAVWIYLLTGAGTLWFLAYRYFADSFCPKPIIVYASMAVISTAFSVYPDLALYGDPQRFEGVFMHLAYMAIVFLFLNLVSSRFTIRVILVCLLLSSGIIALLGVFQFFGYDYFFSPYGGFWLMPEHFREQIAFLATSVQASTSSNSVFSTFGNRNFAGFYLAMLYPLSLGLFLGHSGKFKWLLAILNGIIYAGLLGCTSRAAFLSAGVASVFLLMLFRREIRRQSGFILILVCYYALVPFIFDAFTLRHDLPRFFSISGRQLVASAGSYGRFRDLHLDGNTAKIDFDGKELTIKSNNGAIEFYNSLGQFIPHRIIAAADISNSVEAIQAAGVKVASEGLVASENKILANLVKKSYAEIASMTTLERSSSLEPGYLVVFPKAENSGYIIQAWPDRSILRIGRGGNTFYLGFTENGFKLLGNRGLPLEIEEVESWGFNGIEGFGSGRGYIWSRSLPLLKQTLLVGFGPDTFMAHFPNQDYLGKLRHWEGGMSLMIEKPHNIYLQIAINLGGIALIAMLIFWGKYLVKSLMLYLHADFSDDLEVAGAAIFASVLAYLVNGIFNDSIVGIAQVFWALLGMGFAVNQMVAAERAAKSGPKDESGSVAVERRLIS